MALGDDLVLLEELLGDLAEELFGFEEAGAVLAAQRQIKFFLESEENLALPMLCMKQAQHMAVEWIEAHPGYFLWPNTDANQTLFRMPRNTSNQSIATLIDEQWRDDRRSRSDQSQSR